MTSAADLRDRLHQLTALAEEGDVDVLAVNEVVTALTEGGGRRAWTADEVHGLLVALAPLVHAVEQKREDLAVELRAIGPRSRAVRGYGKPAAVRAFYAGQRVNKGT